MMVIEDGAISLTRGDTAYLSVSVQADAGEDYEYQEGDTLTLSVKPDYSDQENYLFQKVIRANETFVIEPEDTKPYAYGRYYYDVQLNTAQGEVFTVVGPAVFKLTREVTL